MRMRMIVLGSIGVIVAAGVGIGAWIALDDDDREVVTRGVCGAATYEFALEQEDDVAEATFEVQSSAPAESWDVAIEQDGTPILQGIRQTDEDAELDIDVPLADGAEEVTVTAVLADGETCTATLTR